MSSHHEHEPHEPWIDRWWPLLIILFGLIFTFVLATFRPGDKRPTAASLTAHSAARLTQPVQLS